MDEIGVFTPEQARLLWQDFKRRQQLQPQLQANYPQRRPIDEPSPHRIFVHNTEVETIPAFGCMRITGVETIGGLTTLSVEKPSSTSGSFLFNGPYPIAADVVEGETTTLGCGWGYRHGTVLMLGDAPSEVGERYQPIVDSWEIESGDGPFIVWGRDQTNERALTGRLEPKGGTGGEIIQFRPVDVCEGIGFTCDCVTAEIVTATCGSALSPGDEVQVWDQSRGWFQMPEALLFNSIGWAHKVKVTEEDSYNGLPFDLGECRWVVISMDCIEQDQLE